jgi:hypothetical protein
MEGTVARDRKGVRYYLGTYMTYHRSLGMQTNYALKYSEPIQVKIIQRIPEQSESFLHMA